jgi:GNAT superfamily N-acetyltransferase
MAPRSSSQFYSSVASTAGYDVLGSDGTPVAVHPAEPEHRTQLVGLLTRLSPRTLRARFLGSGEASYQAYVAELFDPQRTLDAVMACVDGVVVGVGSTHLIREGVAEVAVLVDDAHQHHGIGTLLLEDLVSRARGRGLSELMAYVSRDNSPMLDVLHHSGLSMVSRSEGTCVEMTVRLAPTHGSGTR